MINITHNYNKNTLKNKNKSKNKSNTKLNKIDITDDTCINVELVFQKLEKWNSEDFRQKLYQSIIKVFGVLKAAQVVFSVEKDSSFNSNNDVFNITTQVKNINIINTAIIMFENNVKPIIRNKNQLIV